MQQTAEKLHVKTTEPNREKVRAFKALVQSIREKANALNTQIISNDSLISIKKDGKIDSYLHQTQGFLEDLFTTFEDIRIDEQVISFGKSETFKDIDIQENIPLFFNFSDAQLAFMEFDHACANIVIHIEHAIIGGPIEETVQKDIANFIEKRKALLLQLIALQQALKDKETKNDSIT